MGIDNIHILIEPDPIGDRIQQIQAAQMEELAAEHRRGQHPWGSMRRDCPLCQIEK
jgi:hypothetical protein